MRVRGLLITMLVACYAGTAPPPPAPVTAPPPAGPTPVEPAPPTETTATPTPPAPSPTPAPPTLGTVADGGACTAADQCVSGICEGQGCGDAAAGTCMARARGCTRDLRPYCGCDGATFKASGSCPGRRYASKGACSGSAP